MLETNYFYRIAHGPWARLRVSMNDIPFYRREPQEYAITHTNGANHLLLPGENILTLEVFEAPAHVTVIVEITIDHDHENPVLRVDWPKAMQSLPVEAQGLPFVKMAPFVARGVSYRPAYLDAPTTTFWPGGTPELRQAVSDFHAAVAKGDTDAFISAVGLKSDEYMRAYDGAGTFSRESARSEANEFFSKGVQATPLDMDELVFESRAGGRVAYVTRKDGGEAIEAFASDGGRFATDLWLTRYEGAWRIFR